MSKVERILGALALASILGFSMWYTGWVNGKSAERAEINRERIETALCEVFDKELALYRENPPDTPARQARFETYSGLWNDHCTGKEGS